MDTPAIGGEMMKAGVREEQKVVYWIYIFSYEVYP